MYNFESNTYLNKYVLNLVLTQSSTFRFDITLQILLTVLQEKIEVFSRFCGFVEFYYIGAFEFHEDLYLSAHYLLIFNVLEEDGLDS